MKKLILVILVAFVASSSVFANGKKTPKTETAQQQLRNKIIALLKKPQFEIEKSDITANVEFLLNAKNEIVILVIDSEKEMIAEYVKARLNYRKINLDTPQPTNKTFRMTIKVLNPRA